MIDFSIEEGRLEDVVELLSMIPEFVSPPGAEDIRSRISHTPHLILTAKSSGRMLGFKIGYAREGRFYSWLGAVDPHYRRQGIASALADVQETWARESGYSAIWMKTRNCFPEMLMMAISRGFRITGFEPRDEIGQHRIVLEKSI